MSRVLLLIALCLPLLGRSAAAGVLRLTWESGYGSLDWSSNLSGSLESELFYNIMEGLTELDSKGQVRPALAESWTESPDHKTYVFTLRDGVKWTDGVPLKAQDFVFAWRYQLDPKLKHEYAFYLDSVLNAHAYHKGLLKDASQLGVRALDDRHLEVRLERPAHNFLAKLNLFTTFPLRADQLKKYGKAWCKPKNLVTLGPYRITRTEADELVLERNPLFYSRHSGPETVRIFLNVKDPVPLALKGDIDYISTPTAEQIERLLAVPNISGWRVVSFDSMSSLYLSFSLADPIGRQLDFRRAVAMGLDRQSLPAKLRNGAQAAAGIIPPSAAEFLPAGLPFDPERARALLPAGTRHARLACHARYFDFCEILKAMLKANVGLDVDVVNSPDENSYYRRLETHPETFFIATWSTDYYDVGSFFDMLRSDSELSYTGWKSAEFDRLIDQANESFDVAERKLLFKQASDLVLQRDVATIPMLHRKIVVMLNRRVLEFVPFPMVRFFYFKRVKLAD